MKIRNYNVLIQIDPKYLKSLMESIVKKLNGKISDKDAVKKFWFEQNQSERDRIIQSKGFEIVSNFLEVFFNVFAKTGKKTALLKPTTVVGLSLP